MLQRQPCGLLHMAHVVLSTMSTRDGLEHAPVQCYLKGRVGDQLHKVVTLSENAKMAKTRKGTELSKTA
eukprot:948493-Amphidinium_carterae.1